MGAHVRALSPQGMAQSAWSDGGRWRGRKRGQWVRRKTRHLMLVDGSSRDERRRRDGGGELTRACERCGTAIANTFSSCTALPQTASTFIIE